MSPEICKPHKPPLHLEYLSWFSVLKLKACPSFLSSAAKYNRNYKGIFPYLNRFLKFFSH